jgi:hypothetical protein
VLTVVVVTVVVLAVVVLAFVVGGLVVVVALLVVGATATRGCDVEVGNGFVGTCGPPEPAVRAIPMASAAHESARSASPSVLERFRSRRLPVPPAEEAGSISVLVSGTP